MKSKASRFVGLPFQTTRKYADAEYARQAHYHHHPYYHHLKLQGDSKKLIDSKRVL